MSKEEPESSKAKDVDIGDVWFSKSEIERMTVGPKKSVKSSTAKLKKSTSDVTKKTAGAARKQISKTKIISENPRLRHRLKQLTSNKPLFYAGSLLLLALMVGGVWSQASYRGEKTGILGDQSANRPEFDAAVPENTVIEPIYEPDKEVYRYKADYGGARFTVTQQPVPADITDGNLNLQQLAQNIPDHETMESYQSATNGSVYVVSQRGNKQATVLIYNDELLVVITNDGALDSEQILGFINQL